MNRISVLTVILLAICTSYSAYATVIDKNGNEWLQVSDFSNHHVSYKTLDRLFDENGKWMIGQIETVNNINITEYTWASAQEVAQLFAIYGVDTTQEHVTYEYASTWGPTIINAGNMFKPTKEYDNGYKQLFGLTRDEKGWQSSPYYISATYAGITDSAGPGYQDSAFTNGICKYHLSYEHIGAWFYKAPAAVPEPATFLLFGLGILGLAGVSRRKK